jgi:dolichyl-phosphate beta-glucosyltransferase
VQADALTLIIPCYNSTGFIRRTFAEVEDCVRTGRVSRVLFVDDASTDGTDRVVMDMIRRSPVSDRMALLSNAVNSGKGAAIARGLQAVDTEFVCYTDADLAYDTANLSNFLSHARPGCIVTANRVHRDSVYSIRPHFFGHIATRHLASRFLNRLIALMLVPGIEDAQAGLKLAATADLRACLALLTCWRFSFDTELLTVAHVRGMQIVPLPVRFRYDADSSSIRFVRDSVDLLLALARIWVRKTLGRYRR